MSERLPLQIRGVFIRQGIFGCLLVLLALFVISFLFSEYRIRQEMLSQAESMSSMARDRPDLTWFEFTNTAALVLPAGTLESHRQALSKARPIDPFKKMQMERLLARGVGFSRGDLNWNSMQTVQGRHTVYIVRDSSIAMRNLLQYLGIVTVLTILSFAVITWQSYVATKKVLKPVRVLSDVVKSWRPGRLDPTSLLVAESQSNLSIETRNLWQAMYGLATRVSDFVRREKQFLRDASHELRTPLTVIGVATDMLQADLAGNPLHERTLDKIRGAADRIQTKLDALMLLTRETEMNSLSERFEVREIVGSQIAMTRVNFEDHPVEIRMDATADPVVEGSPQAMGLIVAQLLENAMRFTEQGEVVVQVRHDRLRVCDSGIGMEPEIIARAFDPLYRANPYAPEGEGIGLSLVHQLAERAGWSVNLSSEPGKGTCAEVMFRAQMPS